jgi:4-hydroxybenzoate polyprenyltransferase
MSANTTRYWMIVLLATAAGLSVIGKKANSPWIGWLSFVAFLGAVFLYVDWRRRRAADRRAGRVFDREAKTDEDRTRPDK